MAIYRRDDSPYWWYAFKLPGQPQVCASTKTTDRKLAQKIHDIERGKYLEGRGTKKPKKVLLAKLVEDYLQLNFEGTNKLKQHQFLLKAPLDFFKDDMPPKSPQKNWRSIGPNGKNK